MTFPEVLELLGYLLRVVGALVFGVGVGWLTVRTFRAEGQSWQLLVAVFLGLLASFVLLGHWVAGGGALGAFGLGAGAGVLVWGMSETSKPKEEKKVERKK